MRLVLAVAAVPMSLSCTRDPCTEGGRDVIGASRPAFFPAPSWSPLYANVPDL